MTPLLGAAFLALLAQTPLGARIDSIAAQSQFSGVVLVAQHGRPLLQLAYGIADREHGIRNNVETAFNLGSINKYITQIAIRQLAAAGKLDLDSTLARAWPGYPNGDVARRVTIQQIIDHRAGIQGNIFAAPPGRQRSDIRALRDYLPLFVNNPLQFEPGTREEYSNAGYIVLGLLIERLSGETYYDYVRSHIYEPAGMTRTAHWTVDSLPANTAVGYTRGGMNAPPDAPVVSNADLLPGRGSSAGGGYSTLDDLERLLNALRAGKIPQGQYPGIAIAGGAPGINAAIEASLPGEYDVIVLANLDPPAAGQMARKIRGLLPRQP
jgi:CubicO group peptidase (beta-lactamase class C family)